MISFIVPARNNPEITSDCLLALEHSVKALCMSPQVILIDDDSDKNERISDIFSIFRGRFADCLILRLKKQHHYTGVFSLGLHHAVHENIFFLSNDMMITPSFIQTVLAVGALSESFGIVRGTSAHTDSHPEHRVIPPVHLNSYEKIREFSQAMATIQGLTCTEDRLLSGDAVLIKRKLVEKIGVLDTRFFGYFGDLDYGLRAHLAGFKLVCAKGAWLFHDGGGHVVREAKLNDEHLSLSHQRRMVLVHAAYAEFRKKWDEELPVNYTGDSSFLQMFEMAEKNAHKIALNYQLPEDFLADVEYV